MSMLYRDKKPVQREVTTAAVEKEKVAEGLLKNNTIAEKAPTAERSLLESG